MRLHGILWVSLACAAACGGRVSADNMLLAPSATTLVTGQFRAEAAFSPHSRDGKYFWFATGARQLEVSALSIGYHGGRLENLFSAQWSFLPETSLTPAIAFGLRDVASQSREGVGAYVVVTRHLPIGATSRVFKEFAVTVGIGAVGIWGPFAGFDAKLPWGLFAQGEYDSRDLNGAIGWQPGRSFRLKAYTIRKHTYFGAEIVPIEF